MDHGLTKTSLPAGRAELIGLVTGIIFGALLGEIWGYLESAVSWTNTHDYQVIKAIHGSISALLSHSGVLLTSGLLLAIPCGVIGFIAGLVTGMGMAVLGMRFGPGYEWILINMLGILLGMWLPDGFSLPFYWRLLIISALTGGAVSWLTIYMNRRLLGDRLVTPPFRPWMWAGYILAFAGVTVIAFLLVTGFFFLIRV